MKGKERRRSREEVRLGPATAPVSPRPPLSPKQEHRAFLECRLCLLQLEVWGICKPKSQGEKPFTREGPPVLTCCRGREEGNIFPSLSFPLFYGLNLISLPLLSVLPPVHRRGSSTGCFPQKSFPFYESFQGLASWLSLLHTHLYATQCTS